MKNIIVKLVLLLAALLLAVWAVLSYMKSRVEPPQAPKETNQAAEVVQKALDESDWQGIDLGALWTQYQRLADMMMRLRSDSLRPDYESDLEQLQSLNARYATRLLSMHDSIVEGSYTTAKVREIYPYVSALEQARGPQDEKLLEQPEELRTGLNQMWAFSQSLDKAWQLAGATRFESVEQAESAISRAQTLRGDAKLARCVDLMKAVERLRHSLGRGHYNSLQRAVHSLAVHSNGDYSCAYSAAIKNYSARLDQVKALMNEYDQVANRLYGEQYSLDELWSAINSYVEEANTYYENCRSTHYHE